MLITTLSQIQKELEEIQSNIDVEISEEPTEAVIRGNYCMAQIARTGKLLADAKYHRDKKLSSGIIAQLKRVTALPATTANKFADSLCHDENYIVNWCERLNRACTHQLDWCRTLVSKSKAELQAFNH